jgi:nucleoside-diphosphate-sugar epimerase
MVVSILGCGWYGRSLAQTLLNNNIAVKGSVTSAEKLQTLSALGVNPYLVNFKPDGEHFDPDFFKCDLLVICIPPKTRHGEGSDHLLKVKRIINAIENSSIKNVIYISSTGVYGNTNKEVNELDDPEPDSEAGTVLLAAERLFKDQPAFKATIIRFAGLVGPGRHPGRFFAGKTAVPNGLAPVNLIHLDDCIGITIAVIEQKAFGRVFNASSPDHPSRSYFYGNAAAQAGLTPPEFINELSGWKLVNSVFLRSVLNYEFMVSTFKGCTFN